MLETIIKRAGELSAQEEQEVGDTSREAFAQQAPNDLEWSNSDWFVLGKLDGRVVSLIGVLTREIQVGDTVLQAGGIGGVATLPALQRRGYAGQLLEVTAAFMRDTLKVSHALLVCDPERVHYYEKYGWRPMPAPMYFQHRGNRRRFDGPVMVLSLDGSSWPEGEVDLKGRPW